MIFGVARAIDLTGPPVRSLIVSTVKSTSQPTLLKSIKTFKTLYSVTKSLKFITWIFKYGLPIK